MRKLAILHLPIKQLPTLSSYSRLANDGNDEDQTSFPWFAIRVIYYRLYLDGNTTDRNDETMMIDIISSSSHTIEILEIYEG